MVDFYTKKLKNRSLHILPSGDLTIIEIATSISPKEKGTQKRIG